jgi:iron(II)-dependent oxidoreductase
VIGLALLAISWAGEATPPPKGAMFPPRVAVPAGPATLGADGVPDQAPRRSEEVDAFKLDRAEVSLGQYAVFVQSGGYRDPSLWSEAGLAWLAAHPDAEGDEALRAQGRGPRHPAVNISAYEAEAYCAWAGGRLPGEWEWEKAARADGGGRYPWGEGEDASRANWFSGTKVAVLTRVTTVPTDEGAPQTEAGLMHLTGNVWEWTASDYAASGAGGWRVARGCSWMNLPSYCTTTWREPMDPGERRPTVGARCAE